MTRSGIGALLGSIFITLAGAPAWGGAARIEEVALKVDIRGWTYTLETAIVRPPEGNGPWPLLLVTHGSPRLPADRQKIRTARMLSQARDMAHRGWVSVVIVRRGFGVSDQPFAEGYNCAAPNYRRALTTAAEDVAAVHAVVARWPDVDATRILAMGVSVGGATMLAWATTQPPGLMGVINVSGGTGSHSPRANCDENGLVSTFGSFGAETRVPSLWFYSENDSYLPPDLVRRMHAAYTKAGGPGQLNMFGPVSDDGHEIWTLSEGRRLWMPLVDRFLRERSLPTWDPAPVDRLAQGLNSDARRVLAAYLAWPSEKAMAVSRVKKLARFWGYQSETEATLKGSVSACEKDAGEPCDVVIENFTPRH